MVGLGLIGLAVLPTARWSAGTPEPLLRRLLGPTSGYLMIAAACGVQLAFLINSITDIL